MTGDYFRTLGVKPLLGRLISSNDDTPGCAANAAVISYPFWQRQYGGDSSIIGKSILLDSHSFPVVGITPANFFGMEVGRNFDVVVPACAGA